MLARPTGAEQIVDRGLTDGSGRDRLLLTDHRSLRNRNLNREVLD